MDLIDMLASAHSGQGLGSIGKQFGLDDAQTRTAVEQLAPVVAAGLRRNGSTPQGMVELLQALQGGGHDRYVDDPGAVRFDDVVQDGNGILGHIFGSKDVSREVAHRAAGSTGLSDGILKQMLPVIASMVLGSLTKSFGGSSAPAAQAGGGLGDILSDVLTGGRSHGGGGGLGDVLGDILGGGGRGAGAGSGLDGMLRDILGGGAGGSGSRRPSREDHDHGYHERDMPYDRDDSGYFGDDSGYGSDINEDGYNRNRKRLDDMLGGGTRSGNAADELLNSVEQHLRGRY